MQTPSCFLAVLLGLVLGVTSCTNYSSVSEKRPEFHPVTPAGQIIARTLKDPAQAPQAQIGGFIDAAAAAGAVLAKHPDDAPARKDYNFAVGRIFEVIHARRIGAMESPAELSGCRRQLELLGGFRWQARA